MLAKTNKYEKMSHYELTQHVKHLHRLYWAIGFAIAGIIATAYCAHYAYNLAYEQEWRAISRLTIDKKVVDNQFTIKAARAEEQTEPTTIKEWMLWRVEQTGLNVRDFDCLVRHESNYQQYAINKNRNGSYDLGVMQINDIHHVSRECAFDYRCATNWSIDKIKRDGNMLAWNGFKNNCQ